MPNKRRPPMDVHSAVADLIDTENRRRRLRKMSKAQRKEAARQEKRVRATYDLPQEIIEAIDAIALHEKCPQSHIAALLLLQAIDIYCLDGIKTKKYKQDSRCPRWEYCIQIPAEKLRAMTEKVSAKLGQSEEDKEDVDQIQRILVTRATL